MNKSIVFRPDYHCNRSLHIYIPIMQPTHTHTYWHTYIYEKNSVLLPCYILWLARTIPSHCSSNCIRRNLTGYLPYINHETNKKLMIITHRYQTCDESYTLSSWNLFLLQQWYPPINLHNDSSHQESWLISFFPRSHTLECTNPHE